MDVVVQNFGEHWRLQKQYAVQYHSRVAGMIYLNIVFEGGGANSFISPVSMPMPMSTSLDIAVTKLC